MPENEKENRFLLVSYSNETRLEYFENENELLNRYAEARSNGVTCYAYKIEHLDLELTARRKVKGS